jgi:hypothetical protein
MRQHQRRNNYDTERANAAATRHAQAAPRTRQPVSPQVQEVTDAQRLYFAARDAFKRGECADPRMADYCEYVDGNMVATEMAKRLLAERMVTA